MLIWTLSYCLNLWRTVDQPRLGADFLRYLVVVGFLAYVFIGVSYATMGPQVFSGLLLSPSPCCRYWFLVSHSLDACVGP
jgi:type IV secretory pathway TrbL component